MNSKSRRRRRRGWWPIGSVLRALMAPLAIAFGLALGPHALAQSGANPWELRICADPENFPLSSRDEQGFENRVASIVADELGAFVTYEWTAINETAVRLKLRTGACDVLLSVAENASNMLNTVAWYRAPFAFLYRADAEAVPTSLLDPVLAGLSVGVSPNGFLEKVLTDVGLAASVVEIPIDFAQRGVERYRPLVDGVEQGRADVAIFEATFASQIAAQSNGELAMRVVTPELVPPFSQMFRIATMGVRAEDQALRDTLNRAIAARFDEIQAVLVDMEIPTLSVVQPLPPAPSADAPLRVGFVAPIPTGTPETIDVAARAAWFGARVGDELVGRVEGRADTPVEVLFASAPSPASARRAAHRLVAMDGVTAIVGGIGFGQATALSDTAEALDVLFFNVADGSDDLRDAVCRPRTFHVAPSHAMLADGLALEFGDLDIFVVHGGGDAGQRLAQRVARAWGREGGRVAGSATLEAGTTSAGQILERIEASGARAVVVSVAPPAFELFLIQASMARLDAVVLAVPDAVNQTRDFYYRVRDLGEAFHAAPQLASWDPSLQTHGAADVSLRFQGRSGQPMDPAAWGAYAAIEILADAYAATASRLPADLATYLESETEFDVLKGDGTSFRASTHQLRQPLYLVRVDRSAPWTARVSDRVAIARVVDRVPSESNPPADRLDRLGDLEGASLCTP